MCNCNVTSCNTPCNVTLGSIFENNNITFASVGPPAVVELAQSKVSICAYETVCHVSGFNCAISYRAISDCGPSTIYFVGTCSIPCWKCGETVIIAGEPISQNPYLVVLLLISVPKVRLVNQDADI